MIGQGLKALHFLSLINSLPFTLTNILVRSGNGANHEIWQLLASYCLMNPMHVLFSLLALLSPDPCSSRSTISLSPSLITQSYQHYSYSSFRPRIKLRIFEETFLNLHQPLPHTIPRLRSPFFQSSLLSQLIYIGHKL